VPRRRPDAQLALRRRERVREHERALLGQPERRLVPPAPVVERAQAARQLGSRVDALEVGARNVVPPEEVRPERPRAVALDEEVDVADVVGLENHDERRRVRVEALPDLGRLRRLCERVEQRDLAARLDARRGDLRLPAGRRPPVGVLAPPEPKAGRYIA